MDRRQSGRDKSTRFESGRQSGEDQNQGSGAKKTPFGFGSAIPTDRLPQKPSAAHPSIRQTGTSAARAPQKDVAPSPDCPSTSGLTNASGRPPLGPSGSQGLGLAGSSASRRPPPGPSGSQGLGSAGSSAGNLSRPSSGFRPYEEILWTIAAGKEISQKEEQYLKSTIIHDENIRKFKAIKAEIEAELKTLEEKVRQLNNAFRSTKNREESHKKRNDLLAAEAKAAQTRAKLTRLCDRVQKAQGKGKEYLRRTRESYWDFYRKPDANLAA